LTHATARLISSDVDFLNPECGISLGDDKEDEAVVLEAAKEEKLQRRNHTDGEAMEMAIGNSEIDELA
jgi:hypothetical protein